MKLTSLGERIKTALPQLGLALVLGPCLALLFTYGIILHVEKVMPVREARIQSQYAVEIEQWRKDRLMVGGEVAERAYGLPREEEYIHALYGEGIAG